MATSLRRNFFCLITRNKQAHAIASVFCPVETQVRCSTNKHWDPKWRRHRWAKYIEVNLPETDKIRREANMDPSEIRAKMKKEKRLPPRSFQERDMIIACTNTVFEPYVPPEGDGVASIVSGEGAKQAYTGLQKKGTSLVNVRKIKKYEEDFDTAEFPKLAQEIYIEAHECLNNIKKNEERLHELVSEKAFPEMTWKLDKKTVRWNFVGSLEPPRVVHARVSELLTKDNLYGQVTVRFHTQQTLAVYDRFGRLLYGSEHLVRDCLEYVVFEKRITEMYSVWRIHGKIVPDWMPERDDSVRTKRQPVIDDSLDDEDDEDAGGDQGGEGGQSKTETVSDQPQMATA